MINRYEAALSSTPDNVMMLKNWGDALYQQVCKRESKKRSKVLTVN